MVLRAMGSRTFVAFAVVLFVPVCFAASAFPCHKAKQTMGTGVTCTRVNIPDGLCTACPLRPPNANGQFIKCDDVYDSNVPGCLRKIGEYVEANPCDPVRADALARLKKDPTDRRAHEAIDYFLYAMCEQCCDCVPMGANSDFFLSYKGAHTAVDPTLYEAERGNCPAHAFFDVCKILPNVHYFARVGERDNPALATRPPACKMLASWFNSGASKNWQKNPKTTLSTDLRNFILNMLEVLQCSAQSIWMTCFNLESRQRHLGLPEEAPRPIEEPRSEPPVNELPLSPVQPAIPVPAPPTSTVYYPYAPPFYHPAYAPSYVSKPTTIQDPFRGVYAPPHGYQPFGYVHQYPPTFAYFRQLNRAPPTSEEPVNERLVNKLAPELVSAATTTRTLTSTQASGTIPTVTPSKAVKRSSIPLATVETQRSVPAKSRDPSNTATSVPSYEPVAVSPSVSAAATVEEHTAKLEPTTSPTLISSSIVTS